MMSDDSAADDLLSLYQSFSHAVVNGKDLSEFSKDDLLDIYDYTRGIPDDFLANEAVIAGLRRFPKSKDFIKRKALLFYDLGQEEVCFTTLMSLPERMFVRAVASVRHEIEKFNASPDLCKVLEEYKPGSVEDGDILFLSDIFEDIGRVDVLEQCAETISKISQFPTTIFRCLYNISIENGEAGKAEKYARRLTEIDPFNSSTWVDLGNFYLTKLENLAGAIEAVEYALAIDPENVPAKMIKAFALYEADPQKARQLTQEVLSKNPSDARALYVSACMDFNEKRESEAVDKIISSLAEFNSVQSRDAVDLMLRSITGPLSDSAAQVLEETLRDDKGLNIATWMRDLLGNRSFRGAYELLMAGIRSHRFSSHDPENASVISEVLYRNGSYKDLEFFISQDQPFENLKDLTPFYALIYSLSLFRQGMTGETKRWIEYYLSVLAREPESIRSSLVEINMVNEAALRRLDRLHHFIDGDTDVSESMFDPYI